ncbi:hypothetical protein Plhal304r1_c012g0046251 [Plasmopara halstedii]
MKTSSYLHTCLVSWLLSANNASRFIPRRQRKNSKVVVMIAVLVEQKIWDHGSLNCKCLLKLHTFSLDGLSVRLILLRSNNFCLN